MDSSLRPMVAWPNRHLPPLTSRLLHSSLQAVAAGYLFVAIGMLVRRLAGSAPVAALVTPMIMVTALLTLGSIAARLTWFRLHPSERQFWYRWGFPLAFTLSLAAIAVSLALSGIAFSAVATAWLIVLLGELLVWMPHRWATTRPDFSSAIDRGVASDNGPLGQNAIESAAVFHAGVFDEELDDESLAGLPPGVSQRLTRRADERGCETIAGVFRCEFAAGRRQQIVHVAFCPPLRHRPKVVAESFCDVAVRIKLLQSETFGACFELKLSAMPAKDLTIEFEFFASEDASSIGESG